MADKPKTLTDAEERYRRNLVRRAGEIRPQKENVYISRLDSSINAPSNVRKSVGKRPPEKWATFSKWVTREERNLKKRLNEKRDNNQLSIEDLSQDFVDIFNNAVGRDTMVYIPPEKRDRIKGSYYIDDEGEPVKIGQLDPKTGFAIADPKLAYKYYLSLGNMIRFDDRFIDQCLQGGYIDVHYSPRLSSWMAVMPINTLMAIMIKLLKH